MNLLISSKTVHDIILNTAWYEKLVKTVQYRIWSNNSSSPNSCFICFFKRFFLNAHFVIQTLPLYYLDDQQHYCDVQEVQLFQQYHDVLLTVLRNWLFVAQHRPINLGIVNYFDISHKICRVLMQMTKKHESHDYK